MRRSTMKRQKFEKILTGILINILHIIKRLSIMNVYSLSLFMSESAAKAGE